MDDYALYGFSLFETFRAKQGCFYRLTLHHQRLQQSARVFGLDAPDFASFIQEIDAAHDGRIDEVLRYTLLRSGGSYTGKAARTESRILKRPYTPPSPEPLVLTSAPFPLADGDPVRCHKTGNRIAYHAGLHAAREAGASDCFYVDLQGRFLETTIHNLFFFTDNHWITPADTLGVLPGVVRGDLLEQGLVTQGVVDVTMLDRVTAVAVSNSVQGVQPVQRLGDHTLDTEPALKLADDFGSRAYQPLIAFR